jgi:hypothetical protein
MEAIWVAAEMRAGGAYAHSVIALDAIGGRGRTAMGPHAPKSVPARLGRATPGRSASDRKVPMAQRVLVLTNETLADANEVRESLLPLIAEAGEIYVVVPTVTTWLQSLASDVDGAPAYSPTSACTRSSNMHASGLDARRKVGDEDQSRRSPTRCRISTPISSS